MLLTNCETDLILTWSENCVISNAAPNQATTFAIIYTKLYVLSDTKLYVLSLSTADNAKLLQQLKSGSNSQLTGINLNQKITPQNAPNQYFDFFIEPTFQEVNRLFVLTFNANDSRIEHLLYFLPTEKNKRL